MKKSLSIGVRCLPSFRPVLPLLNKSRKMTTGGGKRSEVESRDKMENRHSKSIISMKGSSFMPVHRYSRIYV